MGGRALVVAVWILAGPTLSLNLAGAQSASDFAATSNSTVPLLSSIAKRAWRLPETA